MIINYQLKIKINVTLTVIVDDFLSLYNALTQSDPQDPHNICTISINNEAR